MITEKVINSLYRTYKNKPASADDLDVGLLFENLIENHDVEIDNDANLIINSVPKESPLHKIALQRIHAIVEFEHKIAIVMHSSILFLNKFDSQSQLHVKPIKASMFDKIFGRLDPDA